MITVNENPLYQLNVEVFKEWWKEPYVMVNYFLKKEDAISCMNKISDIYKQGHVNNHKWAKNAKVEANDLSIKLSLNNNKINRYVDFKIKQVNQVITSDDIKMV